MSKGYEAELYAAKQTLYRSGSVSRMFARKVGMVVPSFGRASGFVDSVFDHKYWFAKLYELMTYYEIGAHEKFAHAGFVMHFIPVFYNMYYDALQSFLEPKHAVVSDLWLTHFRGYAETSKDRESPRAASQAAVMFSVNTGVTAHIQGDMATALETAYRSWSASPKPPFTALKDDLFAKNKPIFEVGKANFFLDVGQKFGSTIRPEVAQLIIGSGERVIGGGLDVDDVHTWRTTAWETAERKLATPAAPKGTAYPPSALAADLAATPSPTPVARP